MDQADEHRFFLSEKDVYVGISPPGETAWMAQDCSDVSQLLKKSISTCCNTNPFAAGFKIRDGN